MTGIHPGLQLDYKQIKNFDPREKLILQKISKPNNQETFQAFSQTQE